MYKPKKDFNEWKEVGSQKHWEELDKQESMEGIKELINDNDLAKGILARMVLDNNERDGIRKFIYSALNDYGPSRTMIENGYGCYLEEEEWTLLSP